MDKYLRSFSTSNLYFAAVLLFLMYLMWLMMKPFVGAIIFAAIITGSVYSLFTWLLEKTKFTRNIVAILICCLVIVAIFFPIIYLSFLLSKEAITFYHSLTVGLNDDLVNNFLFGDGYIARAIRETSTLIGIEINMQSFKVEVVDQLKQLSGLIIDTINGLIGNIVSFLFKFVIMILVIYALLSESSQLKEFLLKLSPLPDDQEELIIDSFNQMNYVTLVCNGVGGLIQGVLAGIGFWLAG
ncbi:MAG TPA: AI-2E family transporter, partial [Crenotrichaceae bacterium]|nr:AI-2E family transporter [Crenotrichaceae bacterium]